MSKSCLWSTHSPIQWAPDVLYLGVKWLEHEADHSPQASAEVRNESSWHGA